MVGALPSDKAPAGASSKLKEKQQNNEKLCCCKACVGIILYTELCGIVIMYIGNSLSLSTVDRSKHE